MPISTRTWLPKDSLVVGEAYAVRARNFQVAIWDGDVFHGLRHKFDSYDIDEESHYDDGPPYGTVKPLRLLK